jgi:oxalate decarboxylase
MEQPRGVRTGRADTITAPRTANPALDAANPDSTVPPPSDTGSMPVFKYPFSLANKRVYQGGWSREVTARELHVAKELAGVNMRLEARGHPRVALAQGRGMVHCALRRRPNHSRRCAGLQLRA